MSIGIAKIDLDTIRDLQKELHEPSNNEELISYFYREFSKSTWYTHLPIRLDCNVMNEKDLTYTVNNTFDFLLYVYKRDFFPALRVKKEFRGRVEICWPHNLGHNTVISAQVKIDDDVLQTIDTIWYDIYSQFYMKPGYRDQYNIYVGNIPALEQWSDFLPEYTTNVPQPFYHARDPSLAIPLLYCSLSKVTYHYKIRARISDLLRMRLCVDNEPERPGDYYDKGHRWRNIPCNLKYIEGADSTGKLSIPELWGRYVYLTDDEREWIKCNFKETGRIYYIDDVIPCKAVNGGKLGFNVSVDLDCKTPCKALFWVAENLTAKKNNNFSNYTTNAENLYIGWNPISMYSLNYSGTSRFENMSSDHSDKMEPWYHFLSPPAEPGYNAYSFSMLSTSLDAEVGLVMAGLKTSLIVSLGNTDPFLKPVRSTDSKPIIEELEQDSISKMSGDDEFMVHARLLVTKKLTFTFNADKDRFYLTVSPK